MRIRIAAVTAVLCLLLSGCGGAGGGASSSRGSTDTVTTTTTDTTTAASQSETSASAATDTTETAAPHSQSTVPSRTGSTASKTTTKTTAATVSKTTAGTTGTVQTPSSGLPGEMRGTWVSYIELADLLASCDTPGEAENAIDGLMDKLASSRMNAVFFHVRANSDAYYPSAYFKNAAAADKLIKAGFDPLAYAVGSAHKRGMQLHAWVNPYRVGTNADYLVSGIPNFKDSSGRYYYVPTSAAAQKLILDGIRELLDNYAVDGIQYDDYFYPEGALEETAVYAFESRDYETYRNAGGDLSVGNWRRAGVDALVAGTYTLVKSKGRVFGISPSHDADKTYDKMFADSKKWLAQSGYVDYLCPQLYFGFEHSSASLDKLTEQWMGYSRHAGVRLYVGLASYKIGLKSDTYAGAGRTEWRDNDDVLKRSVQYLRSKKITGLLFYSSTFFDPATCKVGTFRTDNDLSVAKREIENLLSIL